MTRADDPAAGLEHYEVGGAVRDSLLGRAVSDRDWVVVGSTPQRMIELGFRPVGRDFPVFLHPATHDEYALARTERKTARGHRGFAVDCAPDVSLEDDLRRRDLTINAIARAPDGSLVDPWGGVRDLRDRVLRHVSDSFAEDPVRILRLARFAARFTSFRVAPETESLMRGMVAAGEVDALVPERVWQELSRGLMEPAPSRMIAVLRDCGALARLLPMLPGGHQPAGPAAAPAPAGAIIDAAAASAAPLAARFAALLLDLGAGEPPDDADAQALAQQAATHLKAPTDCRGLAMLAARERRTVARGAVLAPAETLALLERCDALRKPERFGTLLRACAADRQGRAGPPAAMGAPADDRIARRLHRALGAARAVDAGAIAARVTREATDPGRGAGTLPERIRCQVQAERLAAVRLALEPASGR